MSKDHYKYGTPEYQIEDIKENLDKVLTEIGKFRFETGQIKPLSIITFGGNWLVKSRINGNPTNSIESFGKFGNSYYDSFDKNNLQHIQRCYDNAIKFVESAAAEIEKWHEENLPVIENNKKVAQSVRNFMKTIGFSELYKERDTKSRSSKIKYIERRAGFLDDISREIQTNDGYESAKRALEDLKRRAQDWKVKHEAEITKLEKEKEKSDRQIRLVAKSLELYKEYGLNQEYKTNDQLIELVSEEARERYLNENYSPGLPIDISCCSECSTWNFGEHRCSCGNRRMEMIVNGNILDGFNSYPEAY